MLISFLLLGQTAHDNQLEQRKGLLGSWFQILEFMVSWPYCFGPVARPQSRSLNGRRKARRKRGRDPDPSPSGMPSMIG